MFSIKVLPQANRMKPASGGSNIKRYKVVTLRKRQAGFRSLSPKSPGDAALRVIQKSLRRRLLHVPNVFKIINHTELFNEFDMYTVSRVYHKEFFFTKTFI